MKNKYFNKSALINRHKYFGKTEKFDLRRTPQSFGMTNFDEDLFDYVNSNAIGFSSDKPTTYQPIRSAKNPQNNCDSCRKKTPTHRNFQRSCSAGKVLNPKIIDIDWSNAHMVKQNNRSNSIHSFNNYSMIDFERGETKDYDVLKQSRIAFSISPSHSSRPNQKDKKLPNFLSNRVSPSRSRHYNRMFKLSKEENSELNIRGIFSYPVEGNFNIRKSHLHQ